jgi:hydrogenase expression/formation protein HypC
VLRVTRVTTEGYRAECEACGLKALVGTQLVGPVRPGDYLLVHAGYALAVVNHAAAEASRRLLEELLSGDETTASNRHA